MSSNKNEEPMKRRNIIIASGFAIATLAIGAALFTIELIKKPGDEKLILNCSGEYSYRSVVTGERVNVNAATIFDLDFKTKKYEARDGGAGFVLYNGGKFNDGSEVISFSTYDGDWFTINRVTGVFSFGKESPMSPDLETHISCKKIDAASF